MAKHDSLRCLGLNLMNQKTFAAVEIIRLSSAVVPINYTLDLTINPDSQRFHGVVEIDLMVAESQNQIVLHMDGLVFETIEISDKISTQVPQISKLSEDGTAALLFARAIGLGPVKVSFKYHAPYSTGLEGLYCVDEGGRKSVFTQFQALGARRAFPCFDEPGFKATFDIVIRSPKSMKVISNTREIGIAAHEAKYSVHHFATTKPLPTYLVVIAVGDFDVVAHRGIPKSAFRTWAIPLRGIAPRGKGEQLKTALAMTSKLVLTEEKYFGIAYPFDKLDIIAVPDFGAGGMENAGAITYDEALVLMDDDEPVQSQREFLSIHAHEIAHQWFGNLVTPKWWDDLWLNESFATLMEAKFAAMMQPSWHFETDVLENAHEAMILDGANSVRSVREDVTSVDGIAGAFDAITYQKGGAILAMVEAILGPLEFQNFVQDFLKTHAFGSIDSDDFLKALEVRPNGVQAAQVLKSYINNPGLPVVKLTRLDQRGSYRQSRYLPLGVSALSDLVKPWIIPLGYGRTPRLSNLEDRIDAEVFLPIDEVPRYYIFDIPIDEWMLVLKTIAKRPSAEALAIAINFDMTLMRGVFSLDEYLQGVGMIAKHQDWKVAGFPIARLEFLANAGILSFTQKNLVAGMYLLHLSQPGFGQKVKGSGVKVWLLEVQRQVLAEFFGITGIDFAVQKNLAKLGAAILKEKNHALDDSRIAPYDIVEAALLAKAHTGGDRFVTLAAARLKTCSNASDREIWLRVIAASPASGTEKIIHDLLLSKQLRTQEVPVLLFARATGFQYCNALWDVVEHNIEDLLLRLKGELEITLIQIADDFASEELALRVKSVITPCLGRLRGGAVQLSQTLERIHMNAALIKHLQTTS